MNKNRFIAEVNEFVANHWTGIENPDHWFTALVERGWSGPDWPLEHGGADWSREQQWLYLELTSRNLCPLPDDRFTVLAPLLIALGTDAQQEKYLPGILSRKSNWTITIDRSNDTDASLVDGIFSLTADYISAAAGFHCLLAGDEDAGMGSHLLIFDADELEISTGLSGRATLSGNVLLGENGKGHEHIVRHQSHFLTLAELKTSMQLLRRIDVSNESMTAALTEFQIELDALEAVFLSGRHPGYIDLKSSPLRTRSSELLIDAIGYYGIVAPDALLSSNEPPLPFANERCHLEFIVDQLDRDMVLQKTVRQKDRMFEHLDRSQS